MLQVRSCEIQGVWTRVVCPSFYRFDHIRLGMEHLWTQISAVADIRVHELITVHEYP